MSSYEGGPAPGRGTRIPIRVILAAIIALVGIVMYMSNTQKNPVTGEQQHVALSVDQEKALGLQAAPEMAQKMGGALNPNEDPRARTVEQVGREIVSRSDAGKSPYVGNFHFYLLRDPETVNAFALPGGQVFITLALYRRLTNEAQLAGVLGHEIGHVIERHSAQQMAKGQLGQVLTTAVGVGASDDQGHGRQAAMVAALVNQMMQLNYGRHDETQADDIGLQFMSQAGFTPAAMLDVMKVLQQASQGSHQPEFLSTHPHPETRLREIQAQLDEAYPDGIPANLTEGRSLPGGAES